MIMTALAWLIPAALSLGALGLAAFLWSLRTGQYDDLEGAGWRALDDEADTARPSRAPDKAG
jgi:cbb3-type cytochrome oxidase maturation protein